ncbi:MAG: hypothetical protein D6E12_14375 [Desulfovibrio sp.]|nr:MAG: hypothetical protein D6E12_14375 [Desulfovibrio sp.]
MAPDATLKEGPKRVLLHVCCGPCAIYPVEQSRDQGCEVTGLWFNPNIHPLSEYLRRREGLLEVAAKFDLNLIMLDREYDPQVYLREVSHREANRCFHCYSLRLARTLSVAKRGNFTHISSTLLYSKFQKHDMIAGLGRDLCAKSPVSFLYQDFREGWSQGIKKSKDWGIYRQQYCGCIYSEYERFSKELAEAVSENEAEKGSV